MLSISRFLIQFSLFTLFLILLSFLIKDVLGLESYFIPKYWVIFGFVAGITIIVYFLSWLGINRGKDGQVLLPLGGIVIRLLLSMILVLYYIKKIEVDPVIFVINFFSLYFLFMAFEIYCLLVNLRHQIKK